MNIYWCYDRYEYYGVYVAAETRNKARNFAAIECDDEYININAYIIKKDVKDIVSGTCISCLDLDLLKKYHLRMSCENCDFSSECFYTDTKEYMLKKEEVV